MTRERPEARGRRGPLRVDPVDPQHTGAEEG
jgi:hypothetical protein